MPSTQLCLHIFNHPLVFLFVVYVDHVHLIAFHISGAKSAQRAQKLFVHHIYLHLDFMY